MNMADLVNAFGIASVIGAAVVLVAAKGAKPYSFTTLLAGVGLVTVAATTASTFSNLEVIAKALHLQHRLSDGALEDSLRVNSLWVLIYPALVGAMVINLLTTWFQASKPKTENDLIEETVPRSVAKKCTANFDSAVQSEQGSPGRMRRVRKNERATLVRRR
jgi:hypothetical protein